MDISPNFNKYYHALLGDILSRRKTITIKNDEWSASAKTEELNTEQLKMFFKLIDIEYPKTSSLTGAKNVFGKNQSLHLFRFFGIPLSIKDVTQDHMSSHIRFIDRISYENNIILDSLETHRILQMVEEYEQ
jgi:uncharacterized protein YqfB (UPF0267 family)